ncbi:hypothetical protein PsYK624_138010 [Phanerochaete sordida]|uniref:Uncharacterized protein n=1 Tax=Phanerochaete sordida TaxID=48140 RepID=A0A9P3GLL9_9APHY|nr:hypothetical protein PsYK624_138010 [Phanerochaete sordida]
MSSMYYVSHLIAMVPEEERRSGSNPRLLSCFTHVLVSTPALWSASYVLTSVNVTHRPLILRGPFV